MDKFFYKSRPWKPNSRFSTKFEKSLLEFAAGFLESQEFNHSVTKGIERENTLIKFLSQNLPNNFEVASGEVVDCFGNVSTQLDAMIFDKNKTVKLYDGVSVIIPAEGLLASFEIKSKLTRQEINTSLKSARVLKKLQPYKQTPKIGKRDSDNTIGKFYCRYFHCLFAYGTDLSRNNWAQEEFKRLKEEAKALNYGSHSWIDRIYVNNNGIINTKEEVGVNDENPSVTTLMYLYMHLLNFLFRENERRRPVPYELYSGRLSSGWVKL